MGHTSSAKGTDQSRIRLGRRSGFWRVLWVALVAAVMWVGLNGRWTLASWQAPTEYAGDAFEVLARLRAASEGDAWPMRPQVVERLGAPFGAYWNAYPTPDKPLMLGVGGLARIIGLFPATNLAQLFAQVSAALMFYWVVRRWLRVRWEWAAVGALLFAYTHSTTLRGLGHFSFVFVWTVPLGLLATWLVARSRRLEWRSAGAAVCLGAAGLLGAHNPYYLYFWLQLMAWALVAQWLGARRRANLSIGGTAVMVALAMFAVMHWEQWFFQDEPSAKPLLVRNYGGTERYALKPIELFVPPPTHRVGSLAFVGQRYDRWAEWRGEDFLPYLGIVGIVGFLWMGAAAARRLLMARAVPGQALSTAWLLIFSTVGGVTNVLALFTGLHLFRATNRVVIFLSALVLIFVVVRLSRATGAWPGWLRGLAAAAVLALGLYDQVPRLMDPARRQEIEATVAADEKLAEEMEAALPPGAMIFQLPALGFPEIIPPWRLSDYEHFRPYLMARELRFNYGAAKFRARGRWQWDLADAEPAVLTNRLEAYGFSALYLNRKGFEDGAEALLGELAVLGYDQRIVGADGQTVVVMLRPSAQPVLPEARHLVFGRGWHRRAERGVRWAFADAALSFYNPQAKTRAFRIELELSAPEPQTVELFHEGERVSTFEIGREPTWCTVPVLQLPDGVNVFELRSNRTATRRGAGPNRLRSFGMHDDKITPLEAGNDR